MFSAHYVTAKLNTYGNTTLDQNEQKRGEDDVYENVEMGDQDDCQDEDQDDYENVEMEDQADCEDEDQDDYEIVEDYMEELDTGHEVENIYGNC